MDYQLNYFQNIFPQLLQVQKKVLGEINNLTLPERCKRKATYPLACWTNLVSDDGQFQA